MHPVANHVNPGHYLVGRCYLSNLGWRNQDGHDRAPSVNSALAALVGVLPAAVFAAVTCAAAALLSPGIRSAWAAEEPIIGERAPCPAEEPGGTTEEPGCCEEAALWLYDTFDEPSPTGCDVVGCVLRLVVSTLTRMSVVRSDVDRLRGLEELLTSAVRGCCKSSNGALTQGVDTPEDSFLTSANGTKLIAGLAIRAA